MCSVHAHDVRVHCTEYIPFTNLTNINTHRTQIATILLLQTFAG